MSFIILYYGGAIYLEKTKPIIIFANISNCETGYMRANESLQRSKGGGIYAKIPLSYVPSPSNFAPPPPVAPSTNTNNNNTNTTNSETDTSNTDA